MEQQRETLNHLLVKLFNDILRIEEKALSSGEFADLSVREMHVIEAVGGAGDANSMSAIAAQLGITVGSLTVAVSTLVRKGYLERMSAHYDRRIVQVLLTDKGGRANEHHAAFHREMVDSILREVPPDQTDAMIRLCQHVEHYFSQYLQDENE